jgi:hypothetical protein
MNAVKWVLKNSRLAVLSAVTLLFAGYSGLALSEEVKVTLKGDNEIPPVATVATGTGILDVGPDKSISGSVTISGMTVTVAHIHEAAAGKNGPIVVPLTRTSDSVWTVPVGAKLTDAQYESYKAGNLYFNIHSATHKSGEIRGQIRP